LYVQCGNTNDDHRCWGRPHDFYQCHSRPNPRPCYKASRASDVASDVAAALASTAIVFKYKDSTYSNRLIQKAESLYTFARSRRGKAEDSVKSRDGKTPKNHNGYYDELAWGACWLYKATGDDDYLNKCKTTTEN